MSENRQDMEIKPSWFLWLTLAFAMMFVLAVWLVPLLLTPSGAMQSLHPGERLRLEHTRNILQAVVGLIGILALGLAAWRTSSAAQQAKAALQGIANTHRQLLLMEQSQVTTRFAQAIEQLGSPQLPVRLGAIYALEGIAFDAPNYYRTVLEVLSGFARTIKNPMAATVEAYLAAVENGESPQRPEPLIVEDLRTALKVIQRLIEQKGLPDAAFMVDLQKADFRGLDLDSVNFDNVDLSYATLICVSLKISTIKGSICHKANFQHAKLNHGKIFNCYLGGSIFDYTDFDLCDIDNSILVRCQFNRTQLTRTTLTTCFFDEADFTNASFSQANISQSSFNYAELENCKNLTLKQLLQAKSLYEANLPEELERELRQQKPSLFEQPAEEKLKTDDN